MTMPVGSRHYWTYSRGRLYERKVRPGVWYVDYRVNKNQRAKGRGVACGSRYRWKWVVYQDAVKVGPGRYKTRLRGRKYLVSSKVKKRRNRR